jgi:hypothetical protein
MRWNFQMALKSMLGIVGFVSICSILNDLAGPVTTSCQICQWTLIKVCHFSLLSISKTLPALIFLLCVKYFIFIIFKDLTIPHRIFLKSFLKIFWMQIRLWIAGSLVIICRLDSSVARDVRRVFSLQFEGVFGVLISKCVRIVHINLWGAVVLIENNAFGSVNVLVSFVLWLFGKRRRRMLGDKWIDCLGNFRFLLKF